MTAAPSPTRAYLDHFRDLAPQLPGSALPWLSGLRAAGAERFAALGFPGRRQEAWKYTSLRPLEVLTFDAAAPVASIDRVPELLPAGQTAARLVFVNGRHRPELSSVADLPEGVLLASLPEVLKTRPDLLEAHLGRIGDLDRQAMIALNSAFLDDGAVLQIPPGIEVAAPIELVLVGTGGDRPAVWHPRLLLLAGAGSTATVVEHHLGLGSGVYFANAVTEVMVGEGARLHHIRAQREAVSAFHVSTLAVRIAREAAYDNFVLTQGARLSRNEVHAVLEGPGGFCRLSGAYMVRGDQHCDATTLIEHAVPACSSRQVYKGAIDDRAHAVFQGKIVVRPGAQKTDGYQLNRALLLSDAAEIDSKPELEIYADDVKCSHGATAGELDEEALFYLRSRGIDRTSARALLTTSFLNEAVGEIPVAVVRDACEALVADWLGTT